MKQVNKEKNNNFPLSKSKSPTKKNWVLCCLVKKKVIYQLFYINNKQIQEKKKHAILFYAPTTIPGNQMKHIIHNETITNFP